MAQHLARRILVVISLVAVTGSAAAVLVWGVAPAVGVMIAIMLLAIAGRAFVEGLHFGGGEGSRLAKWSLAVAAGSTLLVACLLISGVRDVWVLAPLAGLNLLFVAFSWPRRTRERVDPTLTREIRLFIFLSMLGSLASTGFSQAAVLVAGVTQSLAFVGQYAAAMTLTTPLGLAASALSAVLFPALAAAHGAKATDLVRGRLRTSTSMMVTIMIGIYIPVVLLSQFIIELVWGEGFQQADWIILYLLPAIVISTIAVPAVSAVTAASNRGMATSAGSSLFGAGVGVVIWLLAGLAGLDYAVPLGFACGTLVIAAIPYVVAWRDNGMVWAADTVVLLAGILVPLTAVILIRAFFVEDAPVASLLCAVVGLLLWCLLRLRSIRQIALQVSRGRRGGR